MTNLEKATKLLEKKEFVEKVVDSKDKAAVVELFKANGVELTDADYAAIGSILKTAAEKGDDGELPDELAEQVAGGGFDIKNLGTLLGALGGFLTAMEEPINKLMKLFTGDDTSKDQQQDQQQNQQQNQQ